MKYKKLRTFILALVFAAVSLWYCGFEPAAAAGTEDEGSDFDINISCGLDGYGKYSTDLPVCLTVTGHSGDFRGRIRLIPYSENVNTSVNAYDGTQLRPFIVWFGESVPEIETAIRYVEQADIFVIIGTSLNVYPAAGLLNYVPRAAEVYLIDPKPVDTHVMRPIHVIQKGASEGVKELKALLTGAVYGSQETRFNLSNT